MARSSRKRRTTRRPSRKPTKASSRKRGKTRKQRASATASTTEVVVRPTAATEATDWRSRGRAAGRRAGEAARSAGLAVIGAMEGFVSFIAGALRSDTVRSGARAAWEGTKATAGVIYRGARAGVQKAQDYIRARLSPSAAETPLLAIQATAAPAPAPSRPGNVMLPGVVQPSDVAPSLSIGSGPAPAPVLPAREGYQIQGISIG